MLVLVPVATDGNANPRQKFMFNEKKNPFCFLLNYSSSEVDTALVCRCTFP